MKNIPKIFKIVGFNFLLFASILLHAQNNLTDFKVDGGEFTFTKNNAQNPCITQEEYSILDNEVSINLKRIGLESVSNRGAITTALGWPLKQANGFMQCHYHFIGAFVDQNTSATTIQDFNCETNTYDGHHGTDIAVFPYGFYKMDNNQIEVIAAAAGAIVQKADGNIDRNCTSNSLTANSIIIQHADGSQALYWHMKKNSVTSKIVGQTVVAGEYLGVVGSSGSSSGPHLHFEVRTGSTSATYKDPYSGSCNLLNANSWWISQRPHTEPDIMKVSVNTTDLIMSACPTTEIPNESDSYTIPFQGAGLAPGYAKFYVFLREIPANSSLTMRILNPNGTTFNTWNYTIPTFYKASYWGFSKLLPTISGTYTFDATYNGITCSKSFTIINPLSILEISNSKNIIVYPNPTNNEFVISSDAIENGNYTLSLTNITGQLILSKKFDVENNKLEKYFSIADFSQGVYLLILEDSKSRIVKKLVKN
jgi:murein DD-endopeptidase MepM/ murein hydrolase activator NlpD